MTCGPPYAAAYFKLLKRRSIFDYFDLPSTLLCVEIDFTREFQVQHKEFDILKIFVAFRF